MRPELALATISVVLANRVGEHIMASCGFLRWSSRSVVTHGGALGSAGDHGHWGAAGFMAGVLTLFAPHHIVVCHPDREFEDSDGEHNEIRQKEKTLGGGFPFPLTAYLVVDMLLTI